MSGFVVPFSSSPPSTPDSRSRMANGQPTKSKGFFSNHSTTPAGPPPSSAPSFTPAGPPPSSLFGDSQPSHKTQNKLLFTSNKNLFSSSTPPIPPDEDDMIGEHVVDDHTQGYSEGFGLSNEMDFLPDERSSYSASMAVSHMMGSTSSAEGFGGEFDSQIYGSSGFNTTPRGTKRSRGGATILPSPTGRTAGALREKKESPLPTIARDMATQMGLPTINESHDFITGTENLVSQLRASPMDESKELAMETAIPTIVENLTETWQACRSADLMSADGRGVPNGVLPDDDAPHVYKATFLAGLLLQLHHPPVAKGPQALAVPRINRNDRFSLNSLHAEYNPTAVPKLLLDWLNKSHRPYDAMVQNVLTHDPDPTASASYWDMVLSMVIRGKISDVVKLLKRSQFQHARTARDDGQRSIGYEGSMLRNVDRAVKMAVEVLKICPALQEGDWNLAGTSWVLFRKRVDQALTDLKAFAEGREWDSEPEALSFEAANFGISLPDRKLSRSARAAESQVPWSVYQNLKVMYGILLGGTSEIISSAQDWIEATIGMTVWWDGDEKEVIPVGSLALTRRSLRKSQKKGSRLIDINPTEAYLKQLTYAFDKITGDENEELFQINSMNPVEVGLASIFQGDVEGVVGLLRGWSLPVAAAVAEIGNLGRWYNPLPSTETMNDFDESDLLVLSSYGPREMNIDLDSILVDYAEKLVDIGFLGDHHKATGSSEGWQLAVQLFGRLQDKRVAEKKVLSLVHRLPLESEERVDKIMRTCKAFGIEREGLKIAERYADFIAENTEKYGIALMYYARSHSHRKVKKVFDLLVSLSIVHSMAFPPVASLDDRLKGLIDEPEVNLGVVAWHDQKAARILHLYLTGYATLRKFYDFRDQEHSAHDGAKSQLRPLARQRAAAAALIAVVSSAADNIFGGLYDESRDSVVHVDGLLALLGEALVFVNRPKPIFSRRQNLALLSAVESLETVSARIYSQCEECFKSTLSSYYNSQNLPDPQDMMRKTLSNITSSSGFSLEGSEMLADSVTSGGGSGSMVKIGGRRDRKESVKDDIRRGWDWRKGMKKDAKGEEVLRLLRAGLAQDLAKEWLEGP